MVSTAVISAYDDFWPTSIIEGSYSNKDDPQEMIEWNINKIDQLNGNGNIFEVSWTLTAQTETIAKSILDPTSKVKNFLLYILKRI